jgi:hypothetical protein
VKPRSKVSVMCMYKEYVCTSARLMLEVSVVCVCVCVSEGTDILLSGNRYMSCQITFLKLLCSTSVSLWKSHFFAPCPMVSCGL